MTKKIDCRLAQRGTSRFQAQIASLRHLIVALNSSDSYERYVSVFSLNELRSCFLFPEPLRLRAERKRLIYHLLDATACWNAEERESQEMIPCSMLLDWLSKHFPLTGRGDRRRRQAITRERDRLDREFLERRKLEFAYSCCDVWTGYVKQREWKELASQLERAIADDVNQHIRAIALRLIVEQRDDLSIEDLDTAALLVALRRIAFSRRSCEELLWAMVAVTASTIVEELSRSDETWYTAKVTIAQIVAERPELCKTSAYRQIFEFFEC